MNNIKKYILFYLFLLITIFPVKIYAVCPVCTVAACAGLGLARWLKVDDTISGVWIGGLLVSLIIWTINWLNQKKIKFIGRKILVVLFYYGSVILPLYWGNVIGHPFNTICYLDKLVFGIAIGTIIFILANWLSNYLKKKNNNKVLFPLQRVVIPVVALGITSLVFYFITR